MKIHPARPIRPSSPSRLPRTAVAVCLLCMAVAGCKRTDDGSKGNAILGPPDDTSFSDRLSKATSTWRKAVLLRAITDADQTCDRVIDTAYQQEYRGMGMWRVRCQDRGDWAIFIGAKGEAQAAQCKTLAGNAPRCAPLPGATRDKQKQGRDAP